MRSGAVRRSVEPEELVRPAPDPRPSRAREERRARSFVIAALTLVAALCSFSPLVDPDLGWHLAGGLWILENGRVPHIDPFGAEGRPWLAYSWLFEIVVAGVFEQWGFQGLQVLQLLSVAAVSSACLVCASLSGRKSATRMSHPPSSGDLLVGATFLSHILGCTFLLLLIAPVWQLRPQLFSAGLFSILIYLAVTDRLRPRFLVPLTVLWANLHVFWVLVPVVAFLFSARKGFANALGIALICACCGLVSPYGIENLTGILPYLFDHSAAYALIREFQPLSLDNGYLPWAMGAVILLLAHSGREILRRERPELILLVLVLLALSFRQVKYTPLFGIACAPLLIGYSFAGLRLSFENKGRGLSAPFVVLCGFFSGAALTLFLLTYSFPPPLTRNTAELLDVTSRISREMKLVSSRIQVLNHFDDGGWLALGFFLSRKDGRSFATTVDGRTLVMGPERISQFQALAAGDLDIAKQWNADLAVIERDGSLAELLGKSGAPEIRPAGSPHWIVVDLNRL